jgi:DNA helicase-2/ATP-dependent DNA helicase PcrA
MPEPRTPSRFLSEVPSELVDDRTIGGARFVEEPAVDAPDGAVDLYLEQHAVREMAERRLYSGKTYNSVSEVAGFFSERGITVPGAGRPLQGFSVPPRKPTGGLGKPAGPAPRLRGSRPAHSSGFRLGAKVRHAKLGVGTVLKLEGEGEETKLTVHFQSHGLKKLVVKYAGLQPV